MVGTMSGRQNLKRCKTARADLGSSRVDRFKKMFERFKDCHYCPAPAVLHR